MSSTDNKSADELSTIFKEKKLKIGSRDITITEFSFLKGLQVAKLAQPLIDDLSKALRDSGNGDIGISILEQVFFDHFTLFRQLIVESSDIDDLAFFDQLKDNEGQLLLMTFWTVNSGFFLSRLQRRSLEMSRIAEEMGVDQE